MKIAIVAATELELDLCRDYVHNQTRKNVYEPIVSGIGMAETVFNLTKYYIESKPDLIIQIGFCGSVSHERKIGEVFYISEEQIFDLGKLENNKFTPLQEMVFFVKNKIVQDTIFRPKIPSLSSLKTLKKTIGITSNSAHADSFFVKYLNENFPSALESMEGAALFMVCQNLNIECLQLRAVSNYVDLPEKQNWNIKIAQKNLFESFKIIIDELEN
ncbi:MAG: hypothetical protein GX140_10275 [Bacteroidales bacterium]|jgi:futalosine hydrolase|nr:hypothetical protein [Bacteroidales bacterium]